MHTIRLGRPVFPYHSVLLSASPTSRNEGKLVRWETMFRQTKHAYTWAFYSLIRWPLDGDTAGSACVCVCVIYPPSAEIQPVITNLIGCLVRLLIIGSVLALELLESIICHLYFFIITHDIDEGRVIMFLPLCFCPKYSKCFRLVFRK